MRTTRMIQFGSWITTTWRICMACSRKWMVRLRTRKESISYGLLHFCHVIVKEHDLMSKLMVLFLSILARERIVGWYHTGPKLHKNDIAINELIKQYCSNSVCNTVCFTPYVPSKVPYCKTYFLIVFPKGFSHYWCETQGPGVAYWSVHLRGGSAWCEALLKLLSSINIFDSSHANSCHLFFTEGWDSHIEDVWTRDQRDRSRGGRGSWRGAFVAVRWGWKHVHFCLFDMY